MTATDCGGCAGIGAHKRWCREVVGTQASIYGPMSERLEGMGDTIGPNHMEFANKLYTLSGELREYAETLKEIYYEGTVNYHGDCTYFHY